MNFVREKLTRLIKNNHHIKSRKNKIDFEKSNMLNLINKFLNKDYGHGQFTRKSHYRTRKSNWV